MSDLPTGTAESAAPRKTLEERLAEMRTKARDCRKCRAFRQDESGLGFGWCTAFEQYVKLYHPEGGFWSQCQFKVISKSTTPPQADEQETAVPDQARAKGHRTWVPAPAEATGSP